MITKNIALALVAISVAAAPVVANAASRPGGYIGVTTTGVKHWIPNPDARTQKWFQKWLEKERRHGHEFNFDSRG